MNGDILLAYILGLVLGFAILFSVNFAAVRAAFFQHYKVVRWYEATGEWLPRTGSWKEAPTAIGSNPPKLSSK